jgi:hypothetical protein
MSDDEKLRDTLIVAFERATRCSYSEAVAFVGPLVDVICDRRKPESCSD